MYNGTDTSSSQTRNIPGSLWTRFWFDHDCLHRVRRSSSGGAYSQRRVIAEP